jgi:hypothetical protein
VRDFCRAPAMGCEHGGYTGGDWVVLPPCVSVNPGFMTFGLHVIVARAIDLFCGRDAWVPNPLSNRPHDA